MAKKPESEVLEPISVVTLEHQITKKVFDVPPESVLALCGFVGGIMNPITEKPVGAIVLPNIYKIISGKELIPLEIVHAG